MYVAFKHSDKAEIKFPTIEKAKEWANIIENYEPRLHGCFGFIDGQLFPLQEHGSDSVQRLYYNGMDCIHSIKQVTIFGADGTIAGVMTNAPGSYHDSHCIGMMDLLSFLERYPLDLFLATDTAFPATPHIRRKLTENELNSLPPKEAQLADILGSILGKVRCSCEWGNGGIQKTFKVVLSTLPAWQKEYRKILLTVVNRLWNVRTRCMGINQIKTVFD